MKDYFKDLFAEFSKYFITQKNEGTISLFFVILSSALNFTLGILPFIILSSVDKARHLILSNFNEIDPAYTSFLILTYMLLSSSIIYFITNNLNENIKVPKLLFQINSFCSIIGPLFWLMILLANSGLNHLTSIVITVFGIIATRSFFAQMGKKNSHDNKLFTKLFTTILIVFSVSWIFCYLKYEYEIPFPSSTEIIAITSEKLEWSSWVILGGATSLLFYILFIKLRFFPFAHKLNPDNSSREFEWYDWLILGFCLLFILLSGSNHAIDIIILKTILVRALVFMFGILLATMLTCWSFTFNHLDKPKKDEINIPNSFKHQFIDKLVFVVSPVVLLYLFYSFTFPSYSADYYKTGNNITPEDHYKPVPISEGIENWFTENQYNYRSTDTIFILTGQGGGSKAGCTFLNAAYRIENENPDQRNILGMTTISGSSNGAAFYLGLNSQCSSFGLDQLKKLNLTIYNRDFITSSLYKYLFTDDTMLSRSGNRNEALISNSQKAIENACPNSANHLKTTPYNFYSNNPKLPLFFPITYNISEAKKAVTSGFELNEPQYMNTIDIINKNRTKLNIGQGVNLSEMYPIISASAVVNENNYMDGGVYDNMGYEFASEFYESAARVRDEKFPKIKLVVVGIKNSSEAISTPKKYDRQMNAAINSAINSIFTSNVQTHENQLKKLVLSNNDEFKVLECYPKTPPKPKGFLQSLFSLGDEEKVVMSRFLNPKEIDKIGGLTELEVNAMFKELRKKNTVSSHDVYFDFGKSELNEKQRGKITKLDLDLTKIDSISLIAYCDHIGEKYNAKLAKQRVDAVKNILLPKIDKSILKVRSDYNTGTNSNVWTRQFDRKTEIKIYWK